jgi:hypothetical protein
VALRNGHPPTLEHRYCRDIAVGEAAITVCSHPRQAGSEPTAGAFAAASVTRRRDAAPTALPRSGIEVGQLSPFLPIFLY